VKLSFVVRLIHQAEPQEQITTERGQGKGKSKRNRAQQE
jgi:hypothetical protein